MDEATDLVIYKTIDYDKFKFFHENREIKFNYGLEGDILDRNKMKYHPITVNKDFYIIDGQNRYTILKKHNLDIYYMIDDDEFEHDDFLDNISKVQAACRWSGPDYLQHYTKRGFPNYVFISKMLKEHSYLNLSCLIDMFGIGATFRNFRAGKLEFNMKYNEIEIAFEKMDQIEKLYKGFNLSFTNSKHTQMTLFYMCRNPKFDLDRFITKAYKYPDALKASVTFNKVKYVEEELLDNLYNKGITSETNKFKFD